MRRLTAVPFATLAIAAAGCARIFDPQSDFACPAVAYEKPPTVNVTIRDQDGAPAALGAVVTLAGGGMQVRDSTLSDTLTVSGGGYNTLYGVLVSKPYYTAVTVDSVQVPGTFDNCGKPEQLGPPVNLNAVLTLLPGSPPVRALYLRAASGLDILDRGGRDSIKFEPWVDANANVSHAILWRISGDTASVSFNAASGVATFRCRSTLGVVHVVAMSAADTIVSASMTVLVQEHPASSTDPPCS
jgi:hypothetical protein